MHARRPYYPARRHGSHRSRARSADGSLREWCVHVFLCHQRRYKSLASSTPVEVPRFDIFFGTSGHRQLHHSLDLATVKLFCVTRIPPAVVDSFGWKDLFPTQFRATHQLQVHVSWKANNVRAGACPGTEYCPSYPIPCHHIIRRREHLLGRFFLHPQ